MATGRRAFAAPSAIEAMHQVLTAEVPPLDEAGRALPAGLEPIVQRALDKDPARRFSSAGDLAFALQELVRQQPATTPKSPATQAIIWSVAALALMAVVWFAAGRRGGNQP